MTDTDYASMSEAELLKANQKVMRDRATAEKASKAEQSKITKALDRIAAKRSAERLVEGMSDAQKVELAKALKGGGE